MLISNTARDLNRAFDDALSAAGGSRPSWLVLKALKGGPMGNQRELAAAVGIDSATLTHHLNAMEGNGLVTRRRDPANRRVHLVELTGKGEAAFQRMLGTVIAFDKRLRTGLDAAEIAQLGQVLMKMRANVSGITVPVAEAGPLKKLVQ